MGGSVAGGDRMSAEDRQVNNPIRDSSFSMGCSRIADVSWLDG